MITGINRERLHRAIDALQQVSDAHQHQLNTAPASMVVGQLLKLGRTIDTMERQISELQALLDAPTGQPDLRLVQGVPTPPAAQAA
jgi:hypothetical protein